MKLLHLNQKIQIQEIKMVNTTFNLDAAVQLFIQSGVPYSKINAGLAFYGRSFAGVPDENNGLFASYTGVPGIGTWENGVFDYWDLDSYRSDIITPTSSPRLRRNHPPRPRKTSSPVP